MRYLLLAFFLLFPAIASAQSVPQSREQITLSFAPVAKQVAPAVVNIFADRVVNERISPFINDPFFNFMFGDQFDMGQLQRKRLEQALGSGVIVAADGTVITNRHVIENAQDIKIILSDRREFPAEVVTLDERTDLAVLKANIGNTRLPVLQLGDSDAMEVGDLVLAIGNPFGVGQSVSSGIVSATARTTDGISDYGYFIQTDAAINPGNSGGALVNMKGELIGINTAIYSRSGGSLGIGFAIPSNMVRTVIDASATGQRPVRPWLGISAQEVTAEMADSLGMDRPQGVVIKAVREGSPLAEAGLKVGDIITSVNGVEVNNPEALRFRVGTQAVGSKASFTFLRRGARDDAIIELIAPPEVPPRQTLTLKGRSPFSGAEVVNLSPAVIDELGYEGPIDSGVMITSVQRGSLAARLGFKPRDIVLEVDRRKITEVNDLARAMGTEQARWRISIQRGNQVINTVVGG
jgi:serine protease Do